MKGRDVLAFGAMLSIVLFFTVGRSWYDAAYQFSPLIVAFVKFSVLSTFGEMCVARITVGSYRPKGFGVLPKMVIWGILGLAVYSAFGIFEAGVTSLIFGGSIPGGTIGRVGRAILISAFMNAFFAPVLMIVHHISDLHIAANAGRFPIRGFDPGAILSRVDWRRFTGFVIGRTIPLFWFPAHTVTFLIPPGLRLVYAAALSVVLGLFMALVRFRPNPASGQGPQHRAVEQAPDPAPGIETAGVLR